MVKGKKKSNEPSGRKITLKMAKNALKVTVDGKRRLDLSNMAIATFPKCILKLCDVEELDLSRNLLKKIPDTINKFVNLRSLDLHSNHLEQVPAAIGHLHNLYSLNLCNNHLTTSGLPHELGLLRNLRILNLGMNRIETLPPPVAALKELQELGLFNNLLTHLPKCIQNLPKLQRLNFKANPIPPDESPEVDCIQRVECLYLVREDCLCTDCLKRCKEEREKLDSRMSAASTLKKSIFAGLITPNSVAQENQAVWSSRISSKIS
uniref:Leucine rich repeat containing 18b n=1 Tax=Sinocyclocheilus anshuiensis TaxID=1608454 RepID=A0A671LRV1_9TELE